MNDTTTATETLEAPITLTPPQPVAAVAPERADQMVKLDDGVRSKLDGQIDEFVSTLVGLDPHSDEFQKRVNTIHNAGDAEVAQSAAMSNRMLDKPMRALESGAVTETSAVSSSLLQLRRLVEELDPARQGDLFQPRKLLGLIPFGNRLADYFDRYTSAQSNIQRVIAALH
ncbi:MAG: toxic anion resistance protein, partial [Solimonas sp.]